MDSTELLVIPSTASKPRNVISLLPLCDNSVPSLDYVTGTVTLFLNRKGTAMIIFNHICYSNLSCQDHTRHISDVPTKESLQQ